MKVWAPSATTVELHYHNQKHSMHKSDSGWWQTDISLNDGDDYGFWVEDQGPFPDPRSLCQPNGVHGLSRYTDLSHSWQDQDWRGVATEKTVIYELHVGTFTEEGTFQGVISRLNYLKELGVTHIELLPIAEFSGEHGWGYDGVQLYSPHHAYGTPNDLMQLVDACHALELGIILDVVYNHLGPSGNYLGQFGPYFHNHYHTPWGQAVNVDGYDSPEVRRFFIDNALMWLRDYHFDGLRLDAVQTIMDGSAIHFLEQLASEVDELAQQLEKPLTLIAESHMNDGRLMMPREQAGYGLQAQWHDDFHHAIYAYLTGERAGYFQDYGKLDDIVKVLNQGVFFDGQYCQYRRRLLGRPANNLNGANFVAYIQNHDQVGNRPGGERLCHLLNLGQMKIAAALLLTSPFIPMLFQGEEWGASTPFYYFTDHPEDNLGKAVKRGRQSEAKEFGWPLTHFSDPQETHSFEKSQLSWDDLKLPECQELLHWYQKLLTIRQRQSSLSAGDFLRNTAHCDPQNELLWVQRENFELICNCSSSTQTAEVHLPSAQICLTSTDSIQLEQYSVTMPPCSVVLLDNTEMQLV